MNSCYFVGRDAGKQPFGQPRPTRGCWRSRCLCCGRCCGSRCSYRWSSWCWSWCCSCHFWTQSCWSCCHRRRQFDGGHIGVFRLVWSIRGGEEAFNGDVPSQSSLASQASQVQQLKSKQTPGLHNLLLWQILPICNLLITRKFKQYALEALVGNYAWKYGYELSIG